VENVVGALAVSASQYAALLDKTREVLKTGKGESAYFNKMASMFPESKYPEIKAAIKTVRDELAKNEPKPLGKISGQSVTLKQRKDGKTIVMNGKEPFYDYENGYPVKVEPTATKEEVMAALRKAEAITSKEDWDGKKPTPKQDALKAKAATTPEQDAPSEYYVLSSGQKLQKADEFEETIDGKSFQFVITRFVNDKGMPTGNEPWDLTERITGRRVTGLGMSKPSVAEARAAL
jgi:hypothetical protein